jgi:hypothetical protein
MAKTPKTCEWFLLCTNPATVARPHPILGSVPTCKRCNDKMNRIDQLHTAHPGGK